MICYFLLSDFLDKLKLLPGWKSLRSEVYTSWHSESLGMTKVTDKKVLQRMSSGDPVVLKGSFSMLATCMCRIWRFRKGKHFYNG